MSAESEQKIAKWCTVLVKNTVDIEDRLAAIAAMLSARAEDVASGYDIYEVTRAVFGAYAALHSTKRNGFDSGFLALEHCDLIVTLSRSAADLSAQLLSSVEEDLGLIPAPSLLARDRPSPVTPSFGSFQSQSQSPSTAAVATSPAASPSFAPALILAAPPPMPGRGSSSPSPSPNTSAPASPTPASRRRPSGGGGGAPSPTPAVDIPAPAAPPPPVGTSPISSAYVPKPRIKMPLAAAAPSSRGGPLVAPHNLGSVVSGAATALGIGGTDDTPDGAWAQARGIVDEVLQDSLVLEGSLFVELRSGGEAPTASGGVLTPRWFTNRESAGVLRYFASDRPDAAEIGSIDLATVQSLSYVRDPTAGAEKRATGIAISLPGGTTLLVTAASEREAVFWMLGLKRIILDQADGSRRASKPVPVPPPPLSPLVPPDAAGADVLLQLDHDHLCRKLEEASEELRGIELSVRHVNSLGDRLQQQFYALNRRKAVVHGSREALAESLRKVETQLASRRGGQAAAAKGKKGRVAPLPSAGMPAPTQPGWASAFKFKKPGVDGAPLPSDAKGVISIWMMSDAYKRLPPVKVQLADEAAPVVFNVSGPEPGGGEASFGGAFHARVITCYPLTEASLKAVGGVVPTAPLPNERELSHIGDPICDHFAARIVGRRVITAIADGCNWGTAPQDAATRASVAFVEFLTRQHHKLCDVRQAGDLLALAISVASEKISEAKEGWQIGTTTLAGGILLENADASLKQPFIWAAISVGDCKMFHYSLATRTIADITESNRLNLTDPSDPGGRLGPHLPGGNPDLRNLRVYMQPCDVGDLLFLCSDGVHDNFDPQHLGDKPDDWQLPYPTWEEASDKAFEQTQLVKAAFRQNHIKKVIFEGLPRDANPSPHRVVKSLVDFSYNTTASSRKWMCEHSKQKLPTDFVLYPGKLDHCSCICFRVGDVPGK